MVDDGLGIIVAQCHACGFQDKGRGLPRFMDELFRHFAELWDIVADIVALGVELLPLRDGVEDAEIGRGIGA